VSLDDEPGQLARLTSRVAEEGLDVRSVLSYYEDETDGHEADDHGADGPGADEHEAGAAPPESTGPGGTGPEGTGAPDTIDAGEAEEPRLRVILRVDTLNVRPLAHTLREEGFRVVWPVAKPS
jgi:acetoin utilization protein AcuB